MKGESRVGVMDEGVTIIMSEISLILDRIFIEIRLDLVSEEVLIEEIPESVFILISDLDIDFPEYDKVAGSKSIKDGF